MISYRTRPPIRRRDPAAHGGARSAIERVDMTACRGLSAPVEYSPLRRLKMHSSVASPRVTTRLRGLRTCQVWAEPATGPAALPESVADTIARGSAGLSA
jgi:hypothetical protein